MSNNYVFVTGGDRGIGRAIVLKFAGNGYTAGFSYNGNREAAEKVIGEIESLGGEGFFVRMVFVRMDFPGPESVEATYREVSELVPHINVLVNNAGVFSVRAFEELTLEEWRRVIDVNSTGVFLVARTFLLLLKKAPWAGIVNVSSIAGQTGNVFASVAYCASKAGGIGLTRRLAVELAPHIRVNAVAPSFVETDITRSMLDTPEKRKAVAELHRSPRP